LAPDRPAELAAIDDQCRPVRKAVSRDHVRRQEPAQPARNVATQPRQRSVIAAETTKFVRHDQQATFQGRLRLRGLLAAVSIAAANGRGGTTGRLIQNRLQGNQRLTQPAKAMTPLLG